MINADLRILRDIQNSDDVAQWKRQRSRGNCIINVHPALSAAAGEGLVVLVVRSKW